MPLSPLGGSPEQPWKMLSGNAHDWGVGRREPPSHVLLPGSFYA
jgi:hypothetical protein